MPILTALVAGMLFGMGLTVAQMVDPMKVINFLDIAAIPRGGWDPTLLMVFIGALPTMFLAYRLREARLSRPAVAATFSIPQRTDVDARLIGGSAMFGIGWGLGGVCPGPALTALALAGGQIGNVALFIAAMIAGIMLSWIVSPAPAAVDAGSEATKPGG